MVVFGRRRLYCSYAARIDSLYCLDEEVIDVTLNCVQQGLGKSLGAWRYEFEIILSEAMVNCYGCQK